MSSRDYFHEKAEESRHNELVGYIMFLAGSVFFIGGILTSLSMSVEPDWLLFIPYSATFTQAFYLELTFLAVGLFLIISGVVSALHFYRDRSFYMCELFEANDAESLLRAQRAQKTVAKQNKRS